MDPNAPFSANVGPPWQLEAWTKQPQQLEDEARAALWTDHTDLESTILNSDRNTMAGQQTSPENEQEELVSGIDPERGKRGSEWERIVGDLTRTEALPGSQMGDPRNLNGMKQVQSNTAD